MSSIPLRSPVTFTFNPHHGPVHAVDCSRFHRHAFISCGQDQCLRIYNLLQVSVVVTVVVSVVCSTSGPVFVYIYTLRQMSVVITVVVSVVHSTSGPVSVYIYTLRQMSVVITVVVSVVHSTSGPVSVYIYGFFFSAGRSLGESDVKTEIACSLSQLGLLCSTYILF